MELRLTAVARVVSASTPMATSIAGPAGKKLLSVVTPCYNEEASIVHCYETVRDILAKELPEYDYEHIIADNASTDRTLDLLRDIAGRDRARESHRQCAQFRSDAFAFQCAARRVGRCRRRIHPGRSSGPAGTDPAIRPSLGTGP